MSGELWTADRWNAVLENTKVVVTSFGAYSGAVVSVFFFSFCCKFLFTCICVLLMLIINPFAATCVIFRILKSLQYVCSHVRTGT